MRREGERREKKALGGADEEDEERALVELDAWQIWFSNLRARTHSGSPSSASSDAAAAAHRTVRANFNFNC